MKTFKPIYWSTLLLLLFLAACGADSAPDLDGDTAEVRIVTSLEAHTTNSLSLQGVPVDPETGLSGVTRAELEVYDSQSGEQLFFKGGQIVSEAEAEVIALTPQDSSVALALPPGFYGFVLTGLDEREPANELAFGVVDSAEIGGADERINIFLGSYLGDITLRTPESVQPNAVFDIFLDVTAPGRPDLRVPEGDYFVAYEAAEPSQVLAESQLGSRIAAACDDVQIVAFLRRVGPRAVGGFDEVKTSVPVSGDACAGSGSEVGADLVPPFIAITSPEAGTNVNTDFTLSGDVNDQQSGINRVEIYEGPVQLGEATLDADDMTWSFDVSLDAGDYTLTAVAFDAAGNSRRQEVGVTVE